MCDLPFDPPNKDWTVQQANTGWSVAAPGAMTRTTIPSGTPSPFTIFKAYSATSPTASAKPSNIQSADGSDKLKNGTIIGIAVGVVVGIVCAVVVSALLLLRKRKIRQTPLVHSACSTIVGTSKIKGMDASLSMGNINEPGIGTERIESTTVFHELSAQRSPIEMNLAMTAIQ